ncbi:MAG: Nif11-like leader peptide family natural product precursor [Thermosynechococcaceae cyanobacterium]
MLSQTVQDFSQRIAASPELQARIRGMTSVGEFMGLSQELGFQLTGDDFKRLTQQVYQQWLSQLPSHSRPFFELLHDNESLNKRHVACRSSADVIALATEHGFALTEADLQQAAQAAAAQEGFSFEKLWFQSLQMI